MCHFFDGWRTSNQMATVDVIDYEKIWPLVNWKRINEFRQKALNPEHPSLRGSAQNPDVYFQNAEASNGAYTAFPEIVQRCMDKVGAVTGRCYHLFDYAGAPDAEVVVVSMGSSCEVVEQTARYLNAHGYKVGQVKVRLFRPFSGEALMAAIPQSAKTVVVLDRTREPGAEGNLCSRMWRLPRSSPVAETCVLSADVTGFRARISTLPWLRPCSMRG